MKQRYTHIKELGSGGFGEVFLALDQAMGKQVAIKYLTKADPDAVDRFRREARILYRELNNKYIVDLLDHDLDDRPPYLVMEYCDGGALSSWVSKRQPWRDVATALMHTLHGLHGIHAAGGFHRDIKPDNLLIATDPETRERIVKVADFGLARSPDATSSWMTQRAAGTPGYMAPELNAGVPYHAGADIYSLGVTATELLTGTRDTATLHAVSIPEGLRGLVLKMRSDDRTRRPTSREVAAALVEILKAPTKPASPPTKVPVSRSPNAGVVVGGLLVGGALLGLLALAANKPQWDDNVQRYRGSDGRFRNG